MQQGSDSLVQRIHEVGALLVVGQSRDALPKVEALESEVKALDFAPLRARVLFMLINARLAEGKRDGLAALVLELINQAEKGFDDSLRVQGLLMLADQTVAGLSSEEAITSCRLASGALARVPDAEWHQTQVQKMLGRRAADNGMLAEAAVAFQAGLDHTHSERDQFELTRGLAEVSEAQGHFARSLELHAAAHEHLVLHQGLHHPDLADDLRRIGALELKAGRFHEGLVSFEAAARIDRENHQASAASEIGVANALRGIGKVSEAAQRLRELEGVTDERPAYDLALARLALALNQPNEAVTRLKDAHSAEGLVVLAEALRRTNRFSDAAPVLEAALKLLDQPASDALLRAEAYFELAQVSLALKQPPAEARTHAAQALAQLHDAEGPALERAAEIKVFLTRLPPSAAAAASSPAPPGPPAGTSR